MSVGPVSWATPGTAAGMKILEEFCDKRLAVYGSQRNDPNKEALSNLSPWLHFGKRFAIYLKKFFTSLHNTKKMFCWIKQTHGSLCRY